MPWARHFYPAGPGARNAGRAGALGAALADIAHAIDRGLSCGPGTLPIVAFSGGAELPDDGVGDLVAVPGGEPV